jgi:hypothetical protein
LPEAHDDVEQTSFPALAFTEAHVEEFLRKNLALLFEDDDERTLLIVGQQVKNLENARNDLIAIDGQGTWC